MKVINRTKAVAQHFWRIRLRNYQLKENKKIKTQKSQKYSLS